MLRGLSRDRDAALRLLGHGAERLGEHIVGNLLVNGDLAGANLDAHLVILGARQPASVLLVLVGRAAAVVEDGDDGRAGALVHSHVKAGGTGAERGGGRREGRGGGDKRGEGKDLGRHGEQRMTPVGVVGV